jgi:hypothetical protein
LKVLGQRARVKGCRPKRFEASPRDLNISYRPQRDGARLLETPVMLMLAWWARRQAYITAVT